jgi:hypothetical protein
MMKITDRTTYVLATAALLGVVVFAQALPAAAAEQTPVPLASTDKTQAERSSADRVEDRIADLHKKLHITAQQTAQWDNVAQVMRDNAKTIREILTDKSQNAKTMSAVDDLHSYRELAQAHVDGLAQLIPVFETLYAGMSGDQKKTADAMFRQPGHHDQHSSSK